MKKYLFVMALSLVMGAAAYAQEAPAQAEPKDLPTVEEMAKMKAGQFSGAVKGNGGVFFFQLIDKKSTGEKYDEKTEMQGVAQTNLRIMANQLANDLARKADVVDNRYKF